MSSNSAFPFCYYWTIISSIVWVIIMLILKILILFISEWILFIYPLNKPKLCFIFIHQSGCMFKKMCNWGYVPVSQVFVWCLYLYLFYSWTCMCNGLSVLLLALRYWDISLALDFKSWGPQFNSRLGWIVNFHISFLSRYICLIPVLQVYVWCMCLWLRGRLWVPVYCHCSLRPRVCPAGRAH